MSILTQQAGGSPLPAWTWPGCYPIYYTLSPGAAARLRRSGRAWLNWLDWDNPTCLCHRCANAYDIAAPGFVAGAGIHHEGPPIECSRCGAEIESAYGDPDEDDGSWNDGNGNEG